jgi:hypothetical protein
MLFEVFTIHGCIKLFMEGLPQQDADAILQRMEYFGILKEL